MTDSAHPDDIANGESPASSPTEGDASGISASGRPSSNSFRWKRVVATAGTLFIIGGVTAGAIWYVMNLEPALYPVRGVVTLDDEPMAGGVVLTDHTGGWPGALAGIDDDGSFELITNGEKGAYAGEHKISFTFMDGKFPPSSLIPDKYSDPNNPPFTIEVNAETQTREIKFELSGRKEVKRRGGNQVRRSRAESSSDQTAGTDSPDLDNAEASSDQNSAPDQESE